MSGIRRVSDLGSKGISNILDGSIQTADIAANAITQAKLSTDIPLSGFRNLIINGRFDIWQRGTSANIAATKSTSYLADRWSSYRDVAGSTQSRVDAGLSGFQYALRMQRNSGNTNTQNILTSTSFEGASVKQLAGKQVVLSFYARCGGNYSAGGSTLYASIGRGITNVDRNILYDSFPGYTESVSDVTLTTTWQRFAIVSTIPTDTTCMGLYFFYTPGGTAGVNDYFEITGAQLEAGTEPTPFEQRPIGAELALCQRYYWRVVNDNSNTFMMGNGNAASSTNVSISVPHPVRMRAKPNVIETNGAYPTDLVNYYGGLGAWTINSVSGVDSSFVTNSTTSGLSINRPHGISLQGTNGYFALGCEL
jgi:hypothetical protein